MLWREIVVAMTAASNLAFTSPRPGGCLKIPSPRDPPVYRAQAENGRTAPQEREGAQPIFWIAGRPRYGLSPQAQSAPCPPRPYRSASPFLRSAEKLLYRNWACEAA